MRRNVCFAILTLIHLIRWEVFLQFKQMVEHYRLELGKRKKFGLNRKGTTSFRNEKKQAAKKTVHDQ